MALSSQSAVWQAIAIVTPRELGAPDRHPDIALGAVQPLTRLVEIVQSATIASEMEEERKSGDSTKVRFNARAPPASAGK